MPKASVIMPVFNGAEFIGEAIETVLAQSFTDWELIVVDDGSTDTSANIVRSFGDSRIILVSQPNAGAAAARNSGLAYASGEFVTFFDADDLYLPNALESNATCLAMEPQIAAVYADGYYCDSRGEPYAKLSDFREANVSGCVLDALVTSPFIGASSSAMVRSSCIRRYGLQFDTGLVIGEDWKFFIRLAECGHFGYNPEIICKYRIHGSNVSLAHKQERRAALAKVRVDIVSSSCFMNLSARSQFMIFYQLLFECFPNDRDTQEHIVSTEPFILLKPFVRAKILRLVASYWLLKGTNRETVISSLESALSIDPLDYRARILSLGVRVSPRLSALLLRAKRRANRPHTVTHISCPLDPACADENVK